MNYIEHYLQIYWGNVTGYVLLIRQLAVRKKLTSRLTIVFYYIIIQDVLELILLICKDIDDKKLTGFNYYTVSSKKPIKLRKLINKINTELNGKLKVKIGAKKYRSSEAMKKIDKVKNYPGWKPKVNLVKEILKIFKKHD